MMSFLCRALWCAFVTISLYAQVAPAVEAVWIGGPTGSWSDPANWSTGVVPNDPAPVLFRTINTAIDNDPHQESLVVLDQNATVRQLIIDAGDTLETEVGRHLESDFTLVAGDIHLATGSQLRTVHTLGIQPSGELVMQPGSKAENVIPNASVWNQGRIGGAGAVDGIFYNEGLVSANVAGQTLQLNIAVFESGTNANAGQLIAENGGILSIGSNFVELPQYSQLLTNVTGIIEARGDSRVLLAGGLGLNGGLVRTSSEGGTTEGLVEVNGARLENLRLAGNVQLNHGSLKGYVENNTSAEPSSAPTRWAVIGPTTLTGTGQLTLNTGDLFSSVPIVAPVQPHLTNEAGHTIVGTGSINRRGTVKMSLTNRGLIESYGGNLEIFLAEGEGTINAGRMRALNGSTLIFSGGSSPSNTNQNFVINNSSEDGPGDIAAHAGSTVILGRMTLRGGSLRSRLPVGESSEPAGLILSAADAQTTLRDIRLEGTIGDATSSWRLMGEIENNDVLNATTLQIMGATTLTGGGQVRISQQVIGDGNNTAYESLVNENNVIGGRGIVQGLGLAMFNRGTIQADEEDQVLSFTPASSSSQSNPLVNSGILQAVNGSILQLDARVQNYEGSTPGTILAGGGSEVRVTRVEGGTITSTGTGRVTTSNTAYLTNVRNGGRLQVSPGTLRLSGELINEGTIQSGTGASVVFDRPFVELSGAGVWEASNGPLSLRVGQQSQLPAMLIHGAEHTIRGHGEIRVVSGHFDNQGTLEVQGPAALLIRLDDKAIMSQTGTLIAPAGESMEITTSEQRFTNHGTIDAAGNFLVRRQSAGPLEFVNASGAEIRGGAFFGLASQKDVDSSVLFWNQQDALITGSPHFNLLEDDFQHTALFRNAGVIQPDGGASTSGRVFVHGDFLQDATGLLDFSIAGSASTGWYNALHLQQGGSATLGGSLEISLIEGWEPDLGEAYDIVSTQGGTITGTFDTFTAPALAGRWWSLDYQSDKVVLNVNAITADFNLDGLVNEGDLASWQTAYQTHTSAGDADGDGDTDGRDFLLWQRQYGSGVAVVGSVSVPEPGGRLLILLGTLGRFCRWRRRDGIGARLGTREFASQAIVPRLG